MRLDPDSFPCPVHGTDLCGLVEAELRADPQIVIQPGLRPGTRPRRTQSFLVIVRCPQDGGHEVDLEGKWTP